MFESFEENAKKPYDVSAIKHVHFEEVYLYTVSQLEWIKSFMDSHSGFTFTMCGDPGQLQPVGQELAVDFDRYYRLCLSMLFPRCLTLKISKRVSDPKQREQMFNLCKNLISRDDENLTQRQILSAAGIKFVDFKSLTQNDARYPHLGALNSTVQLINDWCFKFTDFYK